MRLGVSYPVFDGEEWLGFSCGAFRQHVDFVCAVYMTVSYHGNANPAVESEVSRLVALGLVDRAVPFEPDSGLPPRMNEVRARNVGREACRDAGCTHHLTLDVDEMFVPGEFAAARGSLGDEDCSVVTVVNYFKRPTWKIVPEQGHAISFIQKIDVPYDADVSFPVVMDRTRQPGAWGTMRVFKPEEILGHHMSYVRRDMRRKISNNSNWRVGDAESFLSRFDKYQLGERLAVPPDWINRRTTLVEDIFGIGDKWEHPQ